MSGAWPHSNAAADIFTPVSKIPVYRSYRYTVTVYKYTGTGIGTAQAEAETPSSARPGGAALGRRSAAPAAENAPSGGGLACSAG